MLILIYQLLNKNNDIPNDILSQILKLEHMNIKPVCKENKIGIKKNFDKYERKLSDLIDKECSNNGMKKCQIYDSNDDILTLAYKLALLRNNEYIQIFKCKQHNNTTSTFDLLNYLLKCLVKILLIVFIIIIILYTIKRIFQKCFLK